MRKPVNAGNWKMNGDQASIAALLDNLLAGVSTQASADACDMVVFPPAIYLDQVLKATRDSAISCGVQNINAAAKGAYTGEISAGMVVDMGAEYVLVGHSERRQQFGETDRAVAEKVEAAQLTGLCPVICVGESLKQREAGEAESVVLEQLEAVTDRLGIECLNKAIVAYEPVWAIGTGHTASPEQAQGMHAAIRTWLAARNGDVAGALRILYGGSVNAENAETLFSQPDIDGGLVGGASLDAGAFLEINRALMNVDEIAER